MFNFVSIIHCLDFEAESDVFADMELKTINDMAELRSILGASATNKGVSQPTGQSTAAQQYQVPPGQVRPGAYAFQGQSFKDCVLLFSNFNVFAVKYSILPTYSCRN